MYSLGEIEAQCKKASKGVGLSWGLAEEAGLIARHLSEFNLPGSDTVYTNLKFIEDNGWEDNLIDINIILDKTIANILNLSIEKGLLVFED